MRIDLHIGLQAAGAEAMQAALEDKRGRLAAEGVLFSRALGKRNHTRLYMAVTDPDHVDPLRHMRGFASATRQEDLRRTVFADLEAEVAGAAPEVLILSAHQLATLANASEVRRLRDLLAPLSREIRIVVHVDEPARMLTRHYEAALLDGRTAPLSRELAIAQAAPESWRRMALESWGAIDPARNAFPEIHAPAHWLDLPALVRLWDAIFGPGATVLRPFDAEVFAGPGLVDELRGAFAVSATIGKRAPAPLPAPQAAALLTRARQMNLVFERMLAKGYVIPPPLRTRLLGELEVDGAPIAPGSLAALSAHFAPGLAALTEARPELAACLTPDAPCAPWEEADPTRGFRATQYGAAFLPRIDKVTREATRASAARALAAVTRPKAQSLSPAAEAILTERGKENFASLATSRFAPHNRVGTLDETAELPPYTPMPERALKNGSTGRVIVGCMKNEAPYILEWIAHHRAIGVDNFLIYTNGCTDGTDAILDRLQEMGVVQHRNNDGWKGNSPQQYALNRSLKEPLIKQSEWVIHIDVDEFINVRCGNGALDDFLDRVPGATNVAMTWRLFGHNGVTGLSDALVTEQFDHAAPKFCPKPHTVWGFKTMTRNIGAYAKLSCHRPNKLSDGKRDKVRWVNGSGQEMSETYKERGWRSDLRTIGYDLIQLNHYALRSAESFLIKRQRGRALHVDRSIGLNYWVRMDWSDHRDVTIKRNLPRLRAELARLREDEALDALHRAGLDWHRAKVAELHETPEFEELYRAAVSTRLTPTERAAFALALDMES